MSLYLGLWLRRGAPEVRWPWLALGFLIFDGVVLLVGGLAWSREDVLIGLLFPMVVFVVDAAIRRIPFAPFHPQWWIQRYRQERKSLIPDFVAFQVVVAILLISSAVTVGWLFGIPLEANSSLASNLLVVLVLSITFCRGSRCLLDELTPGRLNERSTRGSRTAFYHCPRCYCSAG
jgi:hypothetical protein